jgi:hypothetical protein
MELALIMKELNMWRHHFIGRIFILMKHHCGLKYLFNQPRLNARQAKWMVLINEFDFEIKTLKGRIIEW